MLGVNFQLFQSLTYLTHNWRLQFLKFGEWGVGSRGAGEQGRTRRQGDKGTRGQGDKGTRGQGDKGTNKTPNS